MHSHHVFITGATGYVGRRLIPRLQKRSHSIRVLVRPASKRKAPPRCELVLADPLVRESFADQVMPCNTFVQLVGVPHPSPAKAKLFRSIDRVSGLASIEAAVTAKVAHFVYVSVVQPAPIMKVYQEVRAEVEAALRKSGLSATILRPWYILGPGHRWPYFLLPFYRICECIPSLRPGAQRMGLITLDEMVGALVHAVENPAQGIRVVEVPEIREVGRQTNQRPFGQN